MNKEYRAKKGLERLLWNAVFWSADIYVGMGFVTRCKRLYPLGTRRKTRCTFFGVLWSAFFGTPFFGAPTFMSAWVLLLDVKDSIHWGHEGRLDAPFLECYGAPDFSPIP